MVGRRSTPRLSLQQVYAGGEVRRLGVVRPQPRLVWILVLALLAVGVVLVLSGHGGFDGALGVLVAFLVLVGAAALIQRLTKPAVTFGFNRDGVYTRRQGWIPWQRVRRIEVRRHRARLAGGRTTLWLAFVPEAEPEAEAGAEPLAEPEAAPETPPEGGRRARAARTPGPAAGKRSGPGGPDPDELTWASITPGWGTRRMAQLADRLETLWAAAGRRQPTP